jgi:hypothetical protein
MDLSLGVLKLYRGWYGLTIGHLHPTNPFSKLRGNEL